MVVISRGVAIHTIPCGFLWPTKGKYQKENLKTRKYENVDAKDAVEDNTEE